MASARATEGAVRVLDLDADLGSAIAPAEWERARQMCTGVALRMPHGPFELPNDHPASAYLIASGIVTRELALHTHYMIELLGPGDVIAPPAASADQRLGSDVRLAAVDATLMVGLGQQFSRAAAHWPCLLDVLLARLETQRQLLAVQGAIGHVPRADHRVLMTLGHLAYRWGRVTAEGIVVPLVFTHEILGKLTAASRPTVSLALRQLEVSGLLLRERGGSWLLTAAGQNHLDAISQTSDSVPALGQTITILGRAQETSAESRALRAEARQLRLNAAGKRVG